MNVPLLDLKEQYRGIADDVMRAVRSVIDDQRFILGPVVDDFEHRVEALLGVRHAVGCASGTDALLLALRAFDCPGAEVVTSPFTFFATAGTIHNVGARPVFADI
ncbi:MAG: DegT/DnrJ/EryC1/StrS family aminotransferase, partial [Gemmatimonadetes bacterium]|nr:DegT/DnrJ/EryC1/StrS family aminotransferase [Gemmatimonadota bacterium]